jgi:hypothetical protein
MQPTLSEIYALPPAVLQSGFALQNIQLLQGTLPDEVLRTMRCTMTKCEIEDIPNPLDLHSGTVELTFLDINGDQDYLDGHQRIRNTMTDLIVRQYGADGRPERDIHFYDVHFSSAKQKLDAGANAKDSASLRVNSYTFKTRREIKIT